MNLGNIKKQESPHKIDLFIERLNKRIARLMGKRHKLRPQKKMSNIVFLIMTLVFSILLWLMTGCYYLGEDQFGLILLNGRVVNVVKGIKVGFTAPYPFGGIEIVDMDVTDLIDLSKVTLMTTPFTVLSLDQKQIIVDAKFAYQIFDPRLAFITSLQRQDSLDMFVAWQIQAKLHNYFMQKQSVEILNSNLTVTANEVRDKLNIELAQYGLKVNKLNVYSLKTLHSPIESENQPTAVVKDMPVVASQLLEQAQLYEKNLLIDAQVNINQFNQLLPKYKANPNAIVNQMYYDALSAVPVVKVENYPLLDVPLSQLLLKVDDNSSLSSKQNVNNSVSRERNFSREVNRTRGSELQ